MDIQHILYSTIGDNFEKYLECTDLNVMRQVSNTTRNTEHVKAFVTLMEKFDGIIPPLTITCRLTGYSKEIIVSFYDYLFGLGKISRYSHALIHAEVLNIKLLNKIIQEMNNICDDFQDHLYAYVVYNNWSGGSVDDEDVLNAAKTFKVVCDDDIKEILLYCMYNRRNVEKKIRLEILTRQTA